MSTICSPDNRNLDLLHLTSSGIAEAADEPKLRKQVEVAGYAGEIERLVLLSVQAFDWNCPRHITPRYTAEELHSLAGKTPSD